MLMAEEADHDGDNSQQGAGNIGSLGFITEAVADNKYEERQQGHAQRHAAAINCYAPAPLAKVVTLGLKDEPLVAKK